MAIRDDRVRRLEGMRLEWQLRPHRVEHPFLQLCLVKERALEALRP